MTPEQRSAAMPTHEAHGGDESPDRAECSVCIEALEVAYAEHAWMAQAVKRWTGGNPYAPLTNEQRADLARDRQVELGLGPDLFLDWTEAEKREAFGR